MSSNPPPATPPTTSSTRRRRSSSAATALAASSPAWIQKLLAPFTTAAAPSPIKLAVDQLDEGFFEDTDQADGRSFGPSRFLLCAWLLALFSGAG